METYNRMVNPVQIIALEGCLDAHQGKRVDTLLANATHTSNRTVVNLSKVHFIDSTGLAVLVKGMKHHRKKR